MITIDYKLSDRKPTSINMLRGGLKIEVNGERLNKYSEEDFDFNRSWKPVYQGEHVYYDFVNLALLAVKLEGEDIGLYEPQSVVTIESKDAVFIIERLSQTEIRIAFQRYEPDEASSFLPPAEKARGYIVSIDDYSNAVLDCGQSLLQEIAEMGFDENSEVNLGEDEFANLTDIIERLELLLAEQ